MALFTFLRTACRLNQHNWQTLQYQPLAEISGAFGDLGTLLPLMIALALQGSINLSATLVFSGLFNIATGVLFGIPLPVQPMKASDHLDPLHCLGPAGVPAGPARKKSEGRLTDPASARQAIAAASLASGIPLAETVAAGAWVALAVLFLSLTGLLRWLAVVVPVPVVKGIQLGAGLSLIVSAAASLLGPLRWTVPVLDNRLWALFAFVSLLLSPRIAPRFPYALLAFLLGLAFAIASPLTPFPLANMEPGNPSATPGPVGADGHAITLPASLPFRPAIPALFSLRAISTALGQLPLTTLNSVVAVAALASDLLGAQLALIPAPAPSTTAIGVSVAAMNLIGCWFGAMPVCHGAGGLAAQYRFGARSGASVVLLGAAKLLAGLVCVVEELLVVAPLTSGDGRGTGEHGMVVRGGDVWLLWLLDRFPKAILGVMVVAAGLELARVGQSLNHGASDLWEASGEQEAGRLLGNRHRQVTDAEREERWNVMLVTAAGILAFNNDAVGFVAGLVCHSIYQMAHRIERNGSRGFSFFRGERAPLLQ